jgi:hypothetical protein
LGKLEEADFTLRVGYLVRSRNAFVRSASVFIPGHVPLPLAAHTNTESQNTGDGFLFPQWGKKATLRLEISWCAGLGSHANAGRCAAAFLALETDVAEEAVSGDASTLEEQGERVACDPLASTRQAQKRIALVDCLSDTARSPKDIDFHAVIIAQEEPNHSLLARCHD